MFITDSCFVLYVSIEFCTYNNNNNNNNNDNNNNNNNNNNENNKYFSFNLFLSEQQIFI